MKVIKIVILCCVFLINDTIAQNRCNTEAYLQALLIKYPSLQQQIDEARNKSLTHNRSNGTTEADNIIYIPTVVHILYRNAGDNTNISDAQVRSQIMILNEKFNDETQLDLKANCKIRFCLSSRDPYGNSSTGITRNVVAKEYYVPFNATGHLSGDDQEIKSQVNWNSAKYLNIWVCDLRNYGNQGTFYGYSSFPFNNLGENDGVVINYKYFGNMGTGDDDPAFAGGTALHEIGHWLGLWHTFERHYSEDVNGYTEAECLNDNCSGQNDWVCDTDPIRGPAWGDPLINYSSSNCSKRTNCSGNLISAENYMDYNYDNCLSFFTQGQKERMRDMINIYRNYFMTIPPGELPIECTTPSSGGNGGYGGGSDDCSAKRFKPDKGFLVNRKFFSNSTITLCDEVADIYVTTYLRNNSAVDTALFLSKDFVSMDCSDDNDCGWLSQLLGDCDCGRDVYLYWLSVMYDCDNTFDCKKEVSKWVGYSDNPPNCNTPSDYNVGRALNIAFEPGKYYTIKVAIDENNGEEGGWVEGKKYIYILPKELSISNKNLNGEYQASKDAKLTNVISSSAVRVYAGESITLEAGTSIKPGFEASIKKIDCNNTKVPQNRVANEEMKATSKPNLLVIKKDNKQKDLYEGQDGMTFNYYHNKQGNKDIITYPVPFNEALNFRF